MRKCEAGSRGTIDAQLSLRGATPIQLTAYPSYGRDDEVEFAAKDGMVLRERQALKIWAALHGVVMLAEQGLFTGEAAHATREELVEDFVNETKVALAVAIKDAQRRKKAGA